MTSEPQPGPPPAPIVISGDGVMMGERVPIPDQPAVVVLSIIGAGGLVRADVAIPVGENLDNIIGGLIALRDKLPKANGLHTASAQDLRNLNGHRHG